MELIDKIFCFPSILDKPTDNIEGKLKINGYTKANMDIAVKKNVSKRSPLLGRIRTRMVPGDGIFKRSPLLGNIRARLNVRAGNIRARNEELGYPRTSGHFQMGNTAPDVIFWVSKLLNSLASSMDDSNNVARSRRSSPFYFIH